MIWKNSGNFRAGGEEKGDYFSIPSAVNEKLTSLWCFGNARDSQPSKDCWLIKND